MIETKRLEVYKQPDAVTFMVRPREVIATSPEMDFTMTAYGEEEW